MLGPDHHARSREWSRATSSCRRIEEASRYVPLERLALSPQCGFASTLPGNLLGEAEERRKLELVGRLADEVWG